MEPWDSLPSFCLYGGVRYEAYGDRMRKTIGAMNLDWGIPKMIAEPTLMPDTGGDMAAGVYKVFAVPMTITGWKGMPYSNTPQSVTVEASGKINVTGIPVFSNPSVHSIGFYRTTVDAEAPFYFAGSVSNGTASVALNGNDDTLQVGSFLEPPDALVSDDTSFAGPFRYEKPPAKTQCFAWDGRIFVYGEREIRPGTVSATDGSNVFTASGGLSSQFVGKSLVIDGENVGYNISKVISETECETDQAYSRPHWRDADPSSESFRIIGDIYRVHYSEAGGPVYFPWCNAIDVGRDEGGTLQAHSIHMDEALLFSESDIFALVRTNSYSVPYEFRKTMSAYGCTAPASVVSGGYAVYFWSGERFCRYINNDASPFDHDLGMEALRSINRNLARHIRGVKYGDWILFAVPVGDTEWLNEIWVYNERHDFWDFPWRPFRLVDMAVIYTLDGRQRLWIEAVAGEGFALHEFSPGWRNDGLSNGMFGGPVATAGSWTVTLSIPSIPAGVRGLLPGATIRIVEGTGVGQERWVLQAWDDGATIEIEADRPWSIVPDSTSVVTIGCIESEAVSGCQTAGRPHDEKSFLHGEWGFQGGGA